MVFVKIPQVGLPAAIALAIGLDLGGGYAQEQTGARPYGFTIRNDAPAGTYVLMNPAQGRGPMYTFLDGVRSAGMAPGSTGLFTGGDSAMIWDSAPQEGSRMEPANPPAVRVVQSPPVQPIAEPRMMRPAGPLEAAQARVQIVQRTVPVAEVAPVQAPVQIVQPAVPVAQVAPAQASILAVPAPVVPVQTYQAPVQQPAPPVEVAPAPVAIQAPVQISHQTDPDEPEREMQAPAQQSRHDPEEPEPAPAREMQAPAQQPRQTVPEPNPPPVRAQHPARQPARATPIPIRAQQHDSDDDDERVRVAQAIPTGQARTLLTSIIGDITGTATTGTATPTGTATGATTTTTNGKLTTTNGRTTTTNGKPTTLPTLIPGSALSLTGRPDRWLMTMVLGYVGYEIFF